MFRDLFIAGIIVLVLGALVLLQGCATAGQPGQPPAGQSTQASAGVCVPPEHVARCAQEGGCVFVTNEALMRLLQRAAMQGATAATQACKGAL